MFCSYECEYGRNDQCKNPNQELYERQLFNHIFQQTIVHMAQGCEDIILPLCTHLRKW